MTEQAFIYKSNFFFTQFRFKKVKRMKQTMLFVLLILFINQCLCQRGFPKQFQATLNVTGSAPWQQPGEGLQQLLYDYENLRVRIDIEGWRAKQNETYMVKYHPEGAEADSVRKN